MLSLSIQSLDEMRVSLLASVFTRSLQGDDADHAIMAAEHLKHLSRSLEIEGSNFTPIDSHQLGDLLEDAIKESQQPSQ